MGIKIRGGVKIKGSELGTENRGERKLKGENWSPKFENLKKCAELIPQKLITLGYPF